MNNTEIIDKKIYTSIDVFKFVAAILIVAIHTNPFAGTDVDYYFTCFCRIGVPFFFIATSYFFFRNTNPDIKKYTKRLTHLYFLWFVIELPLIYYKFFVVSDYSHLFNLLNLFRSVFFANTWGASWFIMACILSVNIVYFLSRKLSNCTLLLIAVGTYLISLLSSSYYGLLNQLLDERLMTLFSYFVMAFHPANSFMVALIYIVLGKYIANEKSWKLTRITHVIRSHNYITIVLILILWGGQKFFY